MTAMEARRRDSAGLRVSTFIALLLYALLNAAADNCNRAGCEHYQVER